MERRNFFKLLGAALFPIPEILTTNTVEDLVEKLPKCKETRLKQIDEIVKALSETAKEIWIERHRQEYTKIAIMLSGKNPWTHTYQYHASQS